MDLGFISRKRDSRSWILNYCIKRGLPTQIAPYKTVSLPTEHAIKLAFYVEGSWARTPVQEKVAVGERLATRLA